jgi:hypothetical protein
MKSSNKKKLPKHLKTVEHAGFKEMQKGCKKGAKFQENSKTNRAILQSSLSAHHHKSSLSLRALNQ